MSLKLRRFACAGVAAYRWPGCWMGGIMTIRYCLHCGESFRLRPQVPEQTYCSLPDCQRARKRRWQRTKLQSDPDYQENQRAAQQAWAHRNPDYWRNRRQRLMLGRRDVAGASARRGKGVAEGRVKMDACRLPAGVYRIRPHRRSRGSHNDFWLVQITPVRVRRRRKMDASREDVIDTGIVRS